MTDATFDLLPLVEMNLGSASPTEPVHALDRLADLCLEQALGRRGRKALGETGLAVIVEVPGTGWVTPISEAVERAVASVEVIGVAPKRGVAAPFDEARATTALARGKSVVAVTTAAMALPPSFLATADQRVSVGTPDVKTTRRVIAEVCGGSARALKARDLQNLGLADLAAAIRPGPARMAIERLRRASAQKAASTLTWPNAVPVDDLVGYGEAKVWASRVVADAARLRAGETVTPVSALLCGPPGTGKTMLAQSIARSADLPLIVSNVASWFSGSRGDLDGVIKAMQATFQSAAETAPAILFLDEIDALPSRARLSSRGADWWTPVITGALLEVDALRASGRHVILMAATNYRDHVEPALRRPGRFDLVIDLPIPEGGELQGIFRQHVGHDLDDADIAAVVRLVRRATGAQVVGWVDAARHAAKERHATAITRDDLIAAAVPPDPRTPEELRRVAIHEAGHAVVALSRGLPVREMSIRANGKNAGITSIATLTDDSDEAITGQVMVALGGRAADEVIGDGAGAGAVSDLAAATRMIAAARAAFGLRGSLLHHGPKAIERRLRDDTAFAEAVEADLQSALAAARAIVEDQRSIVEAIAEALVRHKRLDADDLMRVLRGLQNDGRGEAPEARPSRSRPIEAVTPTARGETGNRTHHRTSTR